MIARTIAKRLIVNNILHGFAIDQLDDRTITAGGKETSIRRLLLSVKNMPTRSFVNCARPMAGTLPMVAQTMKSLATCRTNQSVIEPSSFAITKRQAREICQLNTDRANMAKPNNSISGRDGRHATVNSDAARAACSDIPASHLTHRYSMC
jgi:hypothetical protein